MAQCPCLAFGAEEGCVARARVLPNTIDLSARGPLVLLLLSVSPRCVLKETLGDRKSIRRLREAGAVRPHARTPCDRDTRKFGCDDNARPWGIGRGTHEISHLQNKSTPGNVRQRQK